MPGTLCGELLLPLGTEELDRPGIDVIPRPVGALSVFPPVGNDGAVRDDGVVLGFGNELRRPDPGAVGVLRAPPEPSAPTGDPG